MQVTIKTPAEQEQMRVAGRLAADVLDMIAPVRRARRHDRRAQRALPRLHRQRAAGDPGAAQLPRLSQVDLHVGESRRLPRHSERDKRLKQGDIINVDVTVIKDGWHGDTSRMFAVGKIAPAAQRLIDITREAMWIGIRQVRPGARLGDLGAAIQTLRRSRST